MVCIQMTPNTIPYNPMVDEFIRQAQLNVAAGNLAQGLWLLEEANLLLAPTYDSLVDECNFSDVVHEARGSNVSRMSMLDILNPQPFLPRIITPNISLPKTSFAVNFVAGAGCQLGSTVQFLTYVAQTPNAGTHKPLVHLATVAPSVNGNAGYLYVRRRELRLANCDFERSPHYEYFGVQKLPNA